MVRLPMVSTSGAPYVANIFENFVCNRNGSKRISGGLLEVDKRNKPEVKLL
jgi:hypothetical protein